MVGAVNLNSLSNKVNSVFNLVLNNNLYILGVCETWLVSSMSSCFVDLPGFLFFRGDVEGNVRKHGVMIESMLSQHPHGKTKTQAIQKKKMT